MEAETLKEEKAFVKGEPVMRLSTALWLPAVLLYGFGDGITSWFILSAGGVEGNPILNLLTETAGAFWPVIVFKVVTLGLLFLCQFPLGRQKWIIPAMLSIVGGFLVAHNFSSLALLL